MSANPTHRYPISPAANKETPQVTSPTSFRHRRAASLAGALALAALLIGALAAPALAAPSLGFELNRKTATIKRGDEVVQYTLKVMNTSPGMVVPGNGLKCIPNSWNPSTVGLEPTFTYQWLRDGISLGSANGAQTTEYTVQGADEGHSLQCVVTGTNANAATSFVTPPLVVSPPPATAPPAPTQPTTASSRPTITTVESTKRQCNPPAAWSGSPTWSYQWLRNGVAIPGATEQKYTPENPGADENKVLQCQVLGTNAGGAAIGISNNNIIGTVSQPPNNPVGTSAFIATPNHLHGPLTLEIEAPPGEESAIQPVTAAAWNCETTPFVSEAERSVATCLSTGSSGPNQFIAPGNTYPSGSTQPLSVNVSVGADTPDTFAPIFRASGGGAPAPGIFEDQMTFEPGLPFGFVPGTFSAEILDKNGLDHTQAGGHPTSASETFEVNWHFNTEHLVTPTGRLKHANTDTPPGFVGNALATPELCQEVDEVIENSCPLGSMVGGIDVFSGLSEVNTYPNNPLYAKLPIYALEPEYGEPAMFAFAIGVVQVVYVFTPELRPEEGYALSLNPAPIVKFPAVQAVDATLCGFGAKRIGSGRFLSNGIGAQFDGCKASTDPGANEIPLITNPTRCAGGPPIVKLSLASWENPDNFVSETFANPEITGCDQVDFEPELNLTSVSNQADSPTGLDVDLSFSSEGLEDPEGIAQAHLKRTRVTFPEGMAINASAGHGLSSCSAEQVKLGTNLPIECPDSAKIGTMSVDTPIIQSDLEGDIYIAKQGAVGGALTGLYIVFDSKKDGLLIKIPAEVNPNPKTGQLVVTIDDSPQAPFSKATLHFPQGPRSVLLTPPKCGKYEIKAEMVPWTAEDLDNPRPDEIVTQTSPFEVTQGPNGGPCPNGNLDPKLEAGTTDPSAGKTSPFVVRLHRDDGTQRFSALNMKVPRGMTAYLKGVPYCPDAVINSIPSALKTGQAEIDSPSCPAASQIGTASAGAGAGSDPFYVNTGRAYLAGPYKGAPASIVVVAPAVAGPLDLGNVVIRNAIYIDPETTEISIASDPIPTIIHGILPDIRDIRVAIDRPGFVLNPTSCEQKSVDVQVKGEQGATASLSNRFQVGGCDQLKFKPTIQTQLFGPTDRGGHPRLRGVLRAKPGDANIKKAVVTIPRSEFLDQAHIRTICTRVQFAADACPKGSIYGKATATTPLLDYELSGPVYLRSSDNELPDLVVAVKGPDYQPIEAAVVGRIDSIKGQIRASFESIPDVPLTKVVLEMRGGKKGLLVNSRDICARTFRAKVQMEGHNGASATNRPVMRNSKCAKAKKRGGKKGRAGGKRRG